MNFPHLSGRSTFRYFTMSTSAFDSRASCRRPFILHRCTHSMLIDLNQRLAITAAVLILGEVNRLEQQASNRQTVLHHFCIVFCKKIIQMFIFFKRPPPASPRSALQDTMILKEAKTSGPITVAEA